MNVKEFGSDIETAVKFMTAHFSRSASKKDKPVLPHSFRVGMKLLEDKYPLNVVLAGFLHDVVEDTDATPEDIARLFGREVAALVSANSRNDKIKDVTKRREELILRCLGTSEAAAIIKAADILDNYQYYLQNSNQPGKDRCQENGSTLCANLPAGYKDKIFVELRQKLKI